MQCQVLFCAWFIARSCENVGEIGHGPNPSGRVTLDRVKGRDSEKEVLDRLIIKIVGLQN